MPSWVGMGFQDSSSFVMGELSFLHDYVMMIMFLVVVVISYILIYLLINVKFYKFFSEGTFIETVWSLIPALLLVILVFPSMKVLYMMEDSKSPVFTFKIIGHQWYWSYASPLYNNYSYLVNGSLVSVIEKDSFFDLDSVSSFPRLLGATADFFVPVNCVSRLLVSSTDVIHSFALPSLGLKVDAVPGRVNQLFMSPSRLGLFFGQCSEICGSNHSFMPISMKVCNLDDFDKMSKLGLLDLMSEN
nr:cytochrome c oxidase subunit II [Scatoglyphus polytrematus]